MKSFRTMWCFVAVFFTAWLLISNVAIAQTDTSERLKFSLDGRDWKKGWSKKTDTMYMIEYVVDDQTVHDWHELVTYQFFPDAQLKVNAEQLKKIFLDDMRERIPSLEVNDISSDPNDEIFEWTMREVPNHTAQDAEEERNAWVPQHEIDRILVGKNGIYFLHYAIKDPDISDKKREQWIDILKQAELVSPESTSDETTNSDEE